VAAESLERYSSQPFPRYRFIPGQHPHPRRDPKGHSYGRPEPRPASCDPTDWRQSEEYRYGVDLYNFAYWWESHEVFEGLWKAVGPRTEQGSFFQALIDLAAGNLKQHMDKSHPAINLWKSSLARLEKLPSPYMGLNIRSLAAAITKRLAGSPEACAAPVILRLLI
jgi:predicted metal-dependent hydrolase